MIFMKVLFRYLALRNPFASLKQQQIPLRYIAAVIACSAFIMQLPVSAKHHSEENTKQCS